jgi:hypothetical protein
MFEPVPGLGIPYIGLVAAAAAILLVVTVQVMYYVRVRRKFFPSYANADLLGNGNEAPATILSVWQTGVNVLPADPTFRYPVECPVPRARPGPNRDAAFPTLLGSTSQAIS